MDVQVVRAEFVYRDTLLVDVGGDGRRHARASNEELKSLLSGKAPKDQVGHWYEAQLIHYGLQRSKQKDTAKVRLQQALSQGKLKVPPHIANLETQMKKDFAAAVRKSKTAAPSPPEGSKRKAQGDGGSTSKKTKITMTVGDVSIEIDHSAPDPPKKQAAAVRKTLLQAEPNHGRPSGNAETAKKQAKGPKTKPAEETRRTKPSRSQQPKSALKSMAGENFKGGAKSQAPAKAEPKLKSESKTKSEPKSKSQPEVKAEPSTKRAAPAKKGPSIKTELKVKSEPSTKRATAVKPDPDIKLDPMQIDSESRTRLVTGTYNFSCHQLAEQLPDQTPNFSLLLCVDTENHKIWGSFQLAMKSGIMLTNDTYTGPDTPLSFGWRARDSWEDGRLAFGRGCFGELTFRGNDQVQGVFYNLFNEPMEFEGRRKPGPLWCGRSAYSFQQEWDGFPAEAYGR